MLLPSSNEIPSVVRHRALSTHKHNCYSSNITGARESYTNHHQHQHQQQRHTEKQHQQQELEQHRSRKASRKKTHKTCNDINTGAAVSLSALLTEYSMVPLGLWNDMRLPSFFSGVFFWPVSESKRGKVRITFMFLSPQLVTSCRFPAPWVDSSFVNSERASQPAM